MAVFEGSAVALVLPMHEDGSIDYDGLDVRFKECLMAVFKLY